MMYGVNNVSFGRTNVFDKPDVTRPQANTRPNAQPAQADSVEIGGKKKKHSFGKVVAGLVGTALVAAGLLVAGNKFNVFKNVGKYIPASIKDASWLQAAKEPVKNFVGKMDKWGGAIADTAVTAYKAVADSSVVKTVKGWFTKGGAAA